MIAAHLRHQARSSEWGCTRKYTPIQPNFDLAPHLHHSHAKIPRAATHSHARLRMPGKAWERLCFSVVPLSRGPVVSQSRSLAVSQSRCLVVPWSRSLSVSSFCRLVGAPPSHSQSFSVIPSLSQSIAHLPATPP